MSNERIGPYIGIEGMVRFTEQAVNAQIRKAINDRPPVQHPAVTPKQLKEIDEYLGGTFSKPNTTGLGELVDS